MSHEDIDKALFRPVRLTRGDAPAPEGARDLDIPLSDGARLGGRLFPHGPAAPNLLYFHGNNETVPDYDEVGPRFAAQGLNFLVFDYRGFGWSDGEPGLRRFLPDAEEALLFLASRLPELGYAGPLAVMGRSLGSACAIDAAARHPDKVRALVIDSGFAKTLPLAKTLGIDLEAHGFSEETAFNNAVKIRAVSRPTLILHGQFDQLIPLWQAELLHAESGARNKELQMVPGADHNSLIAKGGDYYFLAVGRFVGTACGTAPGWRERRRAFKAAQAATERAAAGKEPT